MLLALRRRYAVFVGGHAHVSKGQFAARVRTLVTGHTMLERVAEAMLQAREALRSEFTKLRRAMLAIVRTDEVCRRLMTVPGVGALVAATFTSDVDDPTRIRHSKDAGVLSGQNGVRFSAGTLLQRYYNVVEAELPEGSRLSGAVKARGAA